MDPGSIVQFKREGILLGIIEELDDTWWGGEQMITGKRLWVRFLPELYSSRRTLDNCLQHDTIWVVG